MPKNDLTLYNIFATPQSLQISNIWLLGTKIRTNWHITGVYNKRVLLLLLLRPLSHTNIASEEII